MMNKLYALLIVGVLGACSPQVQVQAPDKPIEINMNVNIDHRVRVEVEKDLTNAIQQNSDIF